MKKIEFVLLESVKPSLIGQALAWFDPDRGFKKCTCIVFIDRPMEILVFYSHYSKKEFSELKYWALNNEIF